MKEIFLISFFILLSSATNEACKGCINLDEYNFAKILTRFKAVLVKFDVAYPYGDKHDVFVSLAGDLVDIKSIIAGEVGIKDYGEKDNSGLAKKYGIASKDDLPAIKLFIDGDEDYIDYPKNKEWTTDNFKRFIRDNTDIYIGLPGCLQQFDKLASDFVKAEEKEKLFKRAESEVEALPNEDDKNIANTYLKFMKKIMDDGLDFMSKETKRLGKILSEGKITEKKKEQLSNRLNVLKSFSLKTEL